MVCAHCPRARKVFGVDADDVDAGDMYVDVVRYLLPVHFRAKDRILKHQVLGNDFGFQDFATAINVLDVGVDSLDALLETALQDLPFCR